MPMAIPLIGAGLSVAAGAAAVAEGYLLVGGLMIAGGAMTAIGTLAGDRNLSKLGGLLSLAGGVTGLATGAWTESAKQLAQNSATQTLEQTAIQTPVINGAANEAASTAAEGLATSAPAYGGVGTAGAGAGTDALGATPTGLGADSGGGALSSTPSLPVDQGMNPNLATSAPAYGGVGTPGAGAGTDVLQASGGGSGLVDNVRGAWKYLTDPKNAKVVEVGSGLVSGALKYAFPSELDKAQIARLQYEQMQRDRLNSSIAGVRNPVPFQANPNAQIFNQAPVDAANRFVPMPGLVNQTRGG